jgi:hypothetical protein
VADQLNPSLIGDAFRRALAGGEPSADLLDNLGGWPALESLAATLVDEPLLTPAISLLARDASRTAAVEGDLAPVQSAAAALTAAVLESSDPGQLVTNIDKLCADPILSEMVGVQIAQGCLSLAVPPRNGGDSPSEVMVLRHAVALETAARLAVQGYASKNKLLGVLEDVGEPQPLRYARAVVRTVTLAYDHWVADDEVADVIDILTGEKAPSYTKPPSPDVITRNDEYRKDIGADAMWAKANVEVAQALRATTVDVVIARLDAALAALEYVTTVDDRDDAALLKPALRLLHGLLVSIGLADPRGGAAAWDASLREAEAIASRAEEFTLGAYGLNHWSGDRKVAVLQGWSRFARDLSYLRDQLDRDSLYEAAVVLDDILAIYSASCSYDITRNDHGVEHVLEVLRPAVAHGFAAQSGLFRNLADHTAAIRRRLAGAEAAGGDTADLRRRLTIAQTVLDATLAVRRAVAESPGKQPEQAAPLPPLLAELIGPHPGLVDRFFDADPVALAALAADIADQRAIGDPDPDVMVTGARKRMLAALASCEDFTGDVAVAATAVLDQLIKFVRQRLNAQEASKPYLFDTKADEHDLHVDLYEWLCQGQFGSSTNVEVQEIGAGRVDIQITFPGFHFYLELKVDETAVPVENKAAYIKQTVTYQATDVRIGFLVVLRKARPKDKSPSHHVTEYVSHTTVTIGDSHTQRHVVMLEIPGNQTKPSSVR